MLNDENFTIYSIGFPLYTIQFQIVCLFFMHQSKITTQDTPKSSVIIYIFKGTVLDTALQGILLHPLFHLRNTMVNCQFKLQFPCWSSGFWSQQNDQFAFVQHFEILTIL